MARMSVDTMVMLGKCAEIELKSMELYDLYADCFEHDVDVARMWRRVAREEENHANQFRLAVKMKDGAIGAVTVDPGKVEDTLRVVQSIIDGVKQSPPTLEDALCSAIQLEEQLSCLHVDCVVTFEDEQYRKFFHAMMTCDNAHVSRLREAYMQQIKTRGQ
ncbi:rubrerythrin [bacterium]|nr:rubrerythrin [bacterium]